MENDLVRAAITFIGIPIILFVLSKVIEALLADLDDKY
jgi:hypothetical protein